MLVTVGFATESRWSAPTVMTVLVVDGRDLRGPAERLHLQCSRSHLPPLVDPASIRSPPHHEVHPVSKMHPIGILSATDNEGASS